MYLVGAPHPHKLDSQQLLEQCVSDGERLVTDAEVLQEILYRYTSINRRDAIQPAFEALLGLVDEVLSIQLPDTQRAKEIVLATSQLSARDALHLAVMESHGVSTILSFDTGFDRHPGIQRLG